MARPRKRRLVCCLPEINSFGPLDKPIDQNHFIVMPVDQYETIRLIDLEGLTQEECAEHMNIARTTVQRIYSDARKKIADSIINGKVLKIQGGEYKLCNGTKELCDGGRCGKHRHQHGRAFMNNAKNKN
ncbi:MAG TPA: DUF134 domain-containing protein [Syntrophomonadaceae bacterium]|nr:DUF134 domain-containing protein [Syntrophomonadaceae bacterium]